jgi:class 3 adenylate cyclase
MKSFSRGELFPSCPQHSATTWGWIPPGSAIGLTDVHNPMLEALRGASPTADWRSAYPAMPYLSSVMATTTTTSGGLFPSSTPLSDLYKTPLTVDIDRKRLDQLQKAEVEVLRLSKEFADIKKQLHESKLEGRAATEKLQEKEKVEQELKTEIEKLGREKKLKHIADGVEPAARKLLGRLPDEVLKYLEEGPCQAFVMSVDIRKSTSLMLKARKPELFAQFITDLCDGLRQAVWDNHGVFDKFTGDGILAFFPLKYSGEDAGYYAIRAAAECHAIFEREYRKHRHCFTSILADVGIGVGIDYGETHLVALWGGLTMVGEPVVYACRLGGAPAGETLLDREAFEIADTKYPASCAFEEVVLHTKSDGNLFVYRAKLNNDLHKPTLPPWWSSLSDDEKTSIA